MVDSLFDLFALYALISRGDVHVADGLVATLLPLHDFYGRRKKKKEKEGRAYIGRRRKGRKEEEDQEKEEEEGARARFMCCIRHWHKENTFFFVC